MKFSVNNFKELQKKAYIIAAFEVRRRTIAENYVIVRPQSTVEYTSIASVPQ